MSRMVSRLFSYLSLPFIFVGASVLLCCCYARGLGRQIVHVHAERLPNHNLRHAGLTVLPVHIASSGGAPRVVQDDGSAPPSAPVPARSSYRSAPAAAGEHCCELRAQPLLNVSLKLPIVMQQPSDIWTIGRTRDHLSSPSRWLL